MSDLEKYEVDYVEIIGYVGGVVLAVALVPQVIKSWTEKSTADISYSWQVIYIVGLWLNFAYFILVDAVAAWVTLLFEIVCAHLLVCLKLHFDGCRNRSDQEWVDYKPGSSKDEVLQTRGSIIQVPFGRQSIIRGSTNARRTMAEISDTFRHSRRSSIDQTAPVLDACRGFHHFVFDVEFEDSEGLTEFGDEVEKEMLVAAQRHEICGVGKLLQVFHTSSSRGFVCVVLLDNGHLTTIVYLDEGVVAFDCFTFGSDPEGSRQLTLDMAKFFKDRLGVTAKVQMGHIPRFPQMRALYGPEFLEP